MSKYDQYNGIASELEKFIKSNQNLFSIIDEARKISKQFDFLKVTEPLRDEIERINSLQQMLSQSILESPIIKMARDANLAISELAKSLQFGTLAEEMSKNRILWENNFGSSSPFGKSIESTFLGIQSEIAKISEISLFAEKSLAQIDFNKIGSLLAPLPEIKNLLADSHYSFSESYSSLFKSYANAGSSFFSLSPILITIPPREFYFENRLIEAISAPQEHIESEEFLLQELSKEVDDKIELYLSSLNPSLINLWMGAKEAATSSNPDAGRHFAVSLRELLTHVIHILSPDDLIRNWSNSPKHYDEKGRPTRNARLLYICKEIKNDSFDEFLIKDIKALLASMDVFEKGTHDIHSAFGNDQANFLSSRVKSAIIFLIRTQKDTHNN